MIFCEGRDACLMSSVHSLNLKEVSKVEYQARYLPSIITIQRLCNMEGTACAGRAGNKKC